MAVEGSGKEAESNTDKQVGQSLHRSRDGLVPMRQEEIQERGIPEASGDQF